jgi:hypothetical protein
MAADDPSQPIQTAQIVWPTKDQWQKGSAEIEEYAPEWKASPALLVIKPELALIVAVKNIEHDERHFALSVAVEETILAPEGFNEKEPIVLECVWNQPYMSMSATDISAPYSFYLHFGAKGVQRVHEFMATEIFRSLGNNSMGILRACFEPRFQFPAEWMKGV